MPTSHLLPPLSLPLRAPQAADQLERLLELMKRVEPRNALLFYHTGLLFARLVRFD